MAFSVIQDVLREPLPADALLPSWWDNDSGSDQARSWLWAGWKVKKVAAGKAVEFVRVTPKPGAARAPGTSPRGGEKKP